MKNKFTNEHYLLGQVISRLVFFAPCTDYVMHLQADGLWEAHRYCYWSDRRGSDTHEQHNKSE